MNDFDLETMGEHNKTVRGYILRSLYMGFHNRLPVKQISNVLMQRNLIISPDISKQLEYLHESGYIEFCPDKVTAYTAYAKDAIVRLTRKGTDLVEQRAEDDGIEI